MKETNRKMTRRDFLRYAGAGTAAALLPACLENYEKEGENAPTLPDGNVLQLETATPTAESEEVLRADYFSDHRLVETEFDISMFGSTTRQVMEDFSFDLAYFTAEKKVTVHLPAGNYHVFHNRFLVPVPNDFLENRSFFDRTRAALYNSRGKSNIGEYDLNLKEYSAFDVFDQNFLSPDQYGSRVLSVFVETTEHSSGANVREVLGNDYYLVVDRSNSKTDDVRREVYAMRQS